MQTVSLLLFFLTFCRYLVKKQTSRSTFVFYRRYDQNANRFFASFFLNKIAIFSPIFLETFYALKILVILLKNRRQDPRLFFIEGMTKMQTGSLLLFFLTKSQFVSPIFLDTFYSLKNLVILLKNRRQAPRLFFIEGMTKMQTGSLLLFFLTFCRYLVKKQTSRSMSVFYRRYDQNANRFFASFLPNKIAIFSPIFLDTFYSLKKYNYFHHNPTRKAKEQKLMDPSPTSISS